MKKDQKITTLDVANPSRSKVRVLIADDHAVLLRVLSKMLSQYSDIEVIGEALDGQNAIRLSEELQPDVILMDISLPGINGLEATRIIHMQSPHIRIIGLSVYDEDTKAASMIESGASAYCAKGGDPNVLLSAIRGEGK